MSRASPARRPAAATTQERLIEALETIPDGFYLFDPDDRLVLINQRAREMLGDDSDRLWIGMPFEELLRFRAPAITEPSHQHDWVQSRLEAHRNPKNFIDQHWRDGRWVRVSERRLADGATVTLLTDVTALKERERALAEMSNLLRTTFEHIGKGITVFDRHGRLVAWNDLWLEIKGLPRGFARAGTPIEDLIQFDAARGEFGEGDVEVLARESISRWAADEVMRYDRVRPDGRVYEVMARPMPDGQRVVTFTDITERKRAEEVAQISEQRLRDIVEAASDWFWETDAQHRLTMLSDRFRSMSDVDIDAVMGRSLAEVMAESTEDTELCREFEEILSERRPFRNVTWNISDAKGERRHFRLSGRPVFDGHGRFCGYRGAGSDDTAAIQAEAKVRHLAHHDALTGLPNRALFHDRLANAIAGATRGNTSVALVLIDLDHFKHVNDTMGHPAGDKVLTMVAQRLAACVRGTDTVARLGGDEFGIIQTDVHDPEDATRLAHRIESSLANAMPLEGHSIKMAASIGIALFPFDAREPERLIENADMALYRAKSEGRNTHRFFSSSLSRQVQTHMSLVKALRSAQARREFQLRFQPQVCLRTGSIVAVESLLRWNRGGIIENPASFIAAAETSGLIHSIGEWVLEAACGQQQAWRANGCPRVRIAVNLSTIQFRDRALLGMIERVLSQSGIPAEDLEIEVTESLLLSEPRETTKVLQALHEIGLSIALDDFGLGYSSLTVLKATPIDRIKIDPSFTAHIGTDAADHALAQSVVTLGHGLGARVVAEGVEGQAQYAALEEMGCDEAQGFFIGIPASATEIEPLLKGGRPIPMAAVSEAAESAVSLAAPPMPGKGNGRDDDTAPRAGS